MTREQFAKLTENTVYLDGAMGTNLYLRGMTRGSSTEKWALEHPEVVTELQSAYVEAGSDIIYAPTFGANRNVLKGFGLEGEIAQMNKDLVALARRSAGDKARVAGDMAPTGLLLEEIGGEATEEEVFAVFREQAALLAAADVDLFVIETMMSVDEARIAFDAVRSVSDLPVMVTFSITENGRCMFGGTAVEGAALMADKGADAVGINCSVGPDQAVDVIRQIKKSVRVPVIAKPNAGLPKIDGSGQAHYEMGAEAFADHMLALREAGASILGGCCGTTPAYIRKLRLRVEGKLI